MTDGLLGCQKSSWCVRRSEHRFSKDELIFLADPTQVLGFSLACYNVFLLPLDVANQQGQFTAAGGIPMKEISVAFFTATAVMSIVVVPFTIFYYEGAEDSDTADGESKWAIRGHCLKNSGPQTYGCQPGKRSLRKSSTPSNGSYLRCSLLEVWLQHCGGLLEPLRWL